MCELRDLWNNWIVSIIESALGIYAIDSSIKYLRPENPYWWILFLTGIILQIPFFYFKLWKKIKDFNLK